MTKCTFFNPIQFWLDREIWVVNHIRNEEVLIGFGKHLTKVRKRKKFSQRKLALLAEIEVSQISRIEKGQTNPTLSTLHAIAQALDMPLSKLCTFEMKQK